VAGFSQTPVLSEGTNVGPLSAEAVRKGDFQEHMREREEARQISQRFSYSSGEGSGGPHRLDERLHPEDGDHPLQIVGEPVQGMR
jgi:hypothetical protein